jgi:hypothetical protein
MRTDEKGLMSVDGLSRFASQPDWLTPTGSYNTLLIGAEQVEH